MNILLKRIVEQQGMDGQFYDLGKDFANFKRTIDGSFEQVKAKYEQAIGSKLVGKRVRARASRGYKQYLKDFEFDVTKITLDDYYDNYVVVAHDNTTPKPKEYFLKPGFKITILGPATRQPSPQKGGKPQNGEPPRVQPPMPNQLDQTDNTQSQPMSPAPSGVSPSDREIDEDTKQHKRYDAYSIESIIEDVKPWIPYFLIKPETPIREFIKGLGWLKEFAGGHSVAMFDIKLPKFALKKEPSADVIKQILAKMSRHGTTEVMSEHVTIGTVYDLVNMEFDKLSNEWHIRIKKTMTENTHI